ncbi:MAG: antirestriction protein ArdA [Oscillospiraceae bacterium]|jgi:hypothetical protein|nr:antirestriction protein ArdA [Oscillospiraceae bacterium]
MSDKKLPLRVFIENSKNKTIGGFTIPLPTTGETLRPWFEAIEADANGKNIEISEVQSDIPELEKALVSAQNIGFDLEELNYLAERVANLDEHERNVFAAVLQYGRYNGSVAKIINITENLGGFTLQPAFSLREYGEYLMLTMQDNFASAFERLRTSENDDDRRLADYIVDLESAVDAEEFGRAAAEIDQGIFTDKGYLTVHSNFREYYLGKENIPKELRLFAEESEMTAFGNRVQTLMDEVYAEWQKEENKSKSKWEILGGFSEAHQIAAVFGNFNYQVENGGLEQWIYNSYFHDDAEKLIEYLETGAAFDDRFRTIRNKLNELDQYAQETDCDKFGYFLDPGDENDTWFLGDMIDCDAFDTWYYKHCGGADWWQAVCGVIDKAENRELAAANREPPASKQEMQSVIAQIREAKAVPKLPRKPKSPDKAQFEEL